GRVDVPDAVSVEQDDVGPVEVVEHGAYDGFGRGEVEIALELVDEEPAGVRFEHAFLPLGTNPRGADPVSPVATPHHGGGGRVPAERMECKITGQPLAHFDAAHTVAPPVERGRPHADAELAGEDGQHSARDAA